MRLVQVTIPAGKRDTVLSVLDDAGVDYVLTDETSHRDYTAIVYFPVPVNGVEPILTDLREAGLDETAFTVVVEATTVVSRHFEELSERYAEDRSEDRIARDELRSTAVGHVPEYPTYVVMTALSAIVATAGLLLNSPAVVVGSMVIAPLVGPALATSVGTVIDERDLSLQGIKMQIVGGVLSIMSAMAFAMLVRFANLVPPGLDVIAIDEVNERLAPDFLALAIALAAGAAGALSFSTGISTALVGVMIAAALVPPAAVVGIGIAWGLPEVVVGSTILVLVNFLSINLAALVVLWYQGYRPEQWFKAEYARERTIRGIGALLGAMLILSLFLGGVTYTSYQSSVTEEAIRGEVDAVLASPEYDQLTRIEVTVVTDDRPIFYEPERVVVTVGLPPGETAPGLADALDERIQRHSDTRLELEIRYVSIERR